MLLPEDCLLNSIFLERWHYFSPCLTLIDPNFVSFYSLDEKKSIYILALSVYLLRAILKVQKRKAWILCVQLIFVFLSKNQLKILLINVWRMSIERLPLLLHFPREFIHNHRMFFLIHRFCSKQLVLNRSIKPDIMNEHLFQIIIINLCEANFIHQRFINTKAIAVTWFWWAIYKLNTKIEYFIIL